VQTLSGHVVALLQELRDHGDALGRRTQTAPAEQPLGLVFSRLHSAHAIASVAAVVTRIILISTTLALAALGAAGCGGSDETAGSDRTTVVAGFYPLAYAAERIGQESVEVRNLTPVGAEPHDLELSPGDVEDVRDADVVLYLGAGFQPALEDAAEGAAGQAVDVLEGMRLLEGSAGHEDEHAGEEEGGHEEEEHGLDPHVWLDPVLYAGVVERIGDVLGRPEEAQSLAVELHTLDEELSAGLADCDRRVLVTSHEAFGYLAARYGLEQIAVTGLSPEAEPLPRDLEKVVELVRESGATTIFFETLLSPELAETVARETGAQTAALNPLEGLTSDEASSGEDYFSIMRRNLASLRDALGCR
jgi:zinc transport system substrate-binding protein